MKKFLLLFAGCLVLGTVAVYSEMPRGEGMRDKGMKQEMGKAGDREGDVGNIKSYLNSRKELNLTSDQVKALEKIRNDYKRDAIKKQADMKIARMDLGQLIRQEKPDFAAAREKIKQISALQLDSKLAMVNAMEQGYNTLTAEQQAKLSQLRKDKKGNWKKEKHEDEK